MLRFLLILVVFSFLFPIYASHSKSIETQFLAQCQREDRPIEKTLRFPKGATGTTIRQRIAVCTSHDYSFRTRAGQQMDVRLITGDRTSLTLYSPSQLIEEADGVQSWSGRLLETGEYRLVIGTDVTTDYTLELTIR